MRLRSIESSTISIIFCVKVKWLTGYKMPREIIFRDELPKSNVGKVLRRELKDMLSN